MRYKVIGLTFVALVAVSAATFVQAQQSDDSSRQPTKLSDRLDKLRKDIFGESRSNNRSTNSRTTDSRTSRSTSGSSRAGSAAHRSGRSTARPTTRPSSPESRPTDLTPEASRSQPPVAGARAPRRVRTADRSSATSARPSRSVQLPASGSSSSVRTAAQSSARSPRTANTASTPRPKENRHLAPQTEAASPYPRGTRPRTAAVPRTASAPRSPARQPASARRSVPTAPAPTAQVAPQTVKLERSKTIRVTPTRVAAAPQPASPKAAAPATETQVNPPKPIPSPRREASVMKRPTTPAERAEPEATTHAASEVVDDAVLFAQRSPLLRVETLGPRQIVVGKESTYRVRIQNLGEVGADSVVVRVRLPRGAEVVSSSTSQGNAQQVAAASGSSDHIEWSIDHVDGRSHEQLELRLIPRDSREFELAVNWSSAASSSRARIEVQEPMLELALDGPGEIHYGDSKVYRLTVSNPGTGDAENVAIQLMPIDGGTQPAAQHQLGTVVAGDSKVLEIELTARQTGNVNINAIVSGDGNLRSEVRETVLVRRAELQVKVAGPPIKYAGTSGSYTVQVSNSGNATADEVQVIASLPPGVADVQPTARGRFDEEAGQVEWIVGPLAAGQTRQLQVRYTMKTPGDNLLSVAAQTDGDVTGKGAVTTEVEATADLKLEVTDPSGPIAVGEEIVYIVRVRNRGSKGANRVELFGFFSEGLEPVEVRQGSGEMSPGQVIFDEIADLRAGGEKVFKIVAKADQGGNHIFHAEVRCKPLGTRLVAEESTLFYDLEARARGKAAASAEPDRAAPAQATPAPATRRQAPAKAAPAAAPVPVATPAEPARAATEQSVTSQPVAAKPAAAPAKVAAAPSPVAVPSKAKAVGPAKSATPTPLATPAKIPAAAPYVPPRSSVLPTKGAPAPLAPTVGGQAPAKALKPLAPAAG